MGPCAKWVQFYQKEEIAQPPDHFFLKKDVMKTIVRRSGCKPILINGLYAIVVFVFTQTISVAQTTTDSIVAISEIVITGFLPNSPKMTSLNITPYSLTKMREYAPYNLCDALAKLPGVSQMTTGNAIAKPVIRGLYGNRILISLAGLRFDNQQWQDEHGMGLSHIGIQRVEVIKGPAALLYGTDAVGGVINIIEEVPDKEGWQLESGTQMFSNTRGALFDAGLLKRRQSNWWRIRASYENHADYRDGQGVRVLNSRSKGTNLKAGFGFERKRWIQENSYQFSHNQYGFIMDDLAASFSADAPWSRTMAGPHHIVMLNILNSQNTFNVKRATVRLNLGLQSNSRREDEGGGQISLNMHLLSALQKLQWEKAIAEKLSIVVNQQFSFINNTNYGGRILIPDANMLEACLGGYAKYATKKIILEAGLGISAKQIKTKETRTLNSGGKEIQPFTRNNLTANLMAGIAYNPIANLTVKANVASGYRAPNLAELSSNGIHEGVYRFEVGDPAIRTERNMNLDLSVLFSKKVLSLSGSLYYNRFFDYIYLSASGQRYFGFPVFRYHQQGARLYGTEWAASFTPGGSSGLTFHETFSLTKGFLDDGSYLPFVPAAQLRSSVKWQRALHKKIKLFSAAPEVQYVFSQKNPAPFESASNDYLLINCYLSMHLLSAKGDWILGLAGKNIGNKRYADHLSRLKYYGLNNEGINIVFSMRKQLQWK